MEKPNNLIESIFKFFDLLTFKSFNIKIRFKIFAKIKKTKFA